MGYAFISYQREDLADVDRLVLALEKGGVQTWIDRQRLEGGAHWRSIVADRIDHAAAFVPCISRNFEKRTDSFIHRELDMAFGRLGRMHPQERWLFPVLMDGAPIPDRAISQGRVLADYNWVDLSQDFDGGAGRLAEDIADLLRSPEQNMATLTIYNSSHTISYVVINGKYMDGKTNNNRVFKLKPGDYEVCLKDDDDLWDTPYDRNFYSNTVKFSARPGEEIVLLARQPKKTGWFSKEASTAWVLELAPKPR